ncbi:MAG TPA: DHA2 family efflux MFS transporter permease subunit [Solirubrobacteraceae bacterium]|nr:DHA2 family efflux MFS transporter permease subunit [Solirubrobacteraceae bacterium]
MVQLENHPAQPASEVADERPHEGAGGEAWRWWALVVLCVPLLIVSLDNTVLNVVLPTLVRKLHATTSELQWIVDAYVIVFGGLLLVAGSLADRVGRKRTFVAGLLLFAAGSAWAAFSGTVNVLIAARASMGIGAALIMPSTLAIITNTFQERGQRQRALGIWSGTSGAGIALGPIVGGLLLAHFWWGSVFLINVPVALIGALVAIPLVPDSRDRHASRLDGVGAALSIAGLGLALWGIIEAPIHGWTSARVLGSVAAGTVVLAGFLAWEKRTNHPMLKLSFFRDRDFSVPVGANGLLMFGLYGALFVLTQLLQFQLGYTPLQAGLRVLPAAGAIALVAPLSTVSVRRLGAKVTLVAGMSIVALGLWQISRAGVATTYAGIVPGMVLLGCGAGLTIPASTGRVMGSLPAANTGVGSATNGAFLQVGGALGVAVIGSLLSTRYQDRLAPILAPYHVQHAIEQAILGSLGGAMRIAAHLGPPFAELLELHARAAFVSGADLGLLVGALVALAGAIVALVALPGRRDARRRA